MIERVDPVLDCVEREKAIWLSAYRVEWNILNLKNLSLNSSESNFLNYPTNINEIFWLPISKFQLETCWN